MAWDHHPPSAGSRSWGPARVPSLQPVPTLIPPAPLETHPALREGQPARPPTNLRCRGCPEVTGGGGLSSHALGPRRAPWGSWGPDRPLPGLVSQQCAQHGSGDPCSPPCSGIAGPETASPFLSWVPSPAGPLSVSVLGPPSLRTSCQDFCVFSELGHPCIII